MALARLPKWDTVLFPQFLAASKDKPFAWGSFDCALSAAAGIEAITGVDVAADFRGKYTTEAGALATIKDVCGGSTVADAAEFVANKFGMKQWPGPLFAQRGDLVVCNAPTGQVVAGLVHLSGKHVVVVGEGGLYRLPIKSVVKAWHY